MVEVQSEAFLPNIATETRINDKFVAFEDYALKVRKPYTITKQRQKWTQEEHTKFLEALKLYGRAWPLIEEHVGNKTAIQIRSHAQKFFSKLVRESNGVDGTEVDPFEIPPPRAKRKPTHPYPRKTLVSSKKAARVSRSTSCSLESNHENESPNSASLLDENSSLMKYGEKTSENSEQSLDEAECAQSMKLFGKTVFVAYERCIAEKITHSFMLTHAEREDLRVRLCM